MLLTYSFFSANKGSKSIFLCFLCFLWLPIFLQTQKAQPVPTNREKKTKEPQEKRKAELSMPFT